MGNIHIFIPDGLHERLRKVCRHKVTQQKYLERVIDEAVNRDAFRGAGGHTLPPEIRRPAPNEIVSNLMRGAESISYEGVELVTAHIDEGGDNVPVQYYVPEGEEE